MVEIRPLLLAILMLALVPGSAAASTNNQIIVKRERGLSAAERADIRADADVRLVDTLSLPRTEVVAAEPGDVAAALRELRADPDVAYAELDAVVRAFSDDEFFEFLWAFENTGQDIFPVGNVASGGTPDADSQVVEAWALAAPGMNPVSGFGQDVAVVDSGIDETHPDLAGQVIDALDYVGNGTDDQDGHGTHVAGTIAALRDNDQGVAGVAPSAKLLNLRVLDEGGDGSMSDVAEAFNEAGNRGVPIVNASLGTSMASETVRQAIKTHPETLFVVAAGNEGRNNDTVPSYPCNTPEPNVLCVGSSTNQDVRSEGSNYGARAVDIFAPGQDIISTIPVAQSGGYPPYEWFTGTSMASPLVAGIAALVREAAPTMTPVEIKQTIMAAGDPLDTFNGRSISGRRANAARAVQDALTPPLTRDDRDDDGWFDAADACPDDPFDADVSPDGCDRDDEWDGVADSIDNCPPPIRNPSQADADGDGIGDACDTDDDNDTVSDSSDECRITPGPVMNAGCPLPPSTPPSSPTPTPTTPAPAAPADSDRDGRSDASDGCPSEYAVSSDGCPLAQVASVSAKVKKRRTRRSATVTVTTTRLARLVITVERRNGRRWVRVARRSVASFNNRATLNVSRLKRGRHRVRISISSGAGDGRSVSKRFRVR